MGRGNQKGGKKHKRGKKDGYVTKALRLKEEGQEYAQITACKGNCRFDVKCFDGTDRIAILCGKMRKRVFVNMQDIVLVSIRDFQDDKCDIIDLYGDTHVHQLKSGNHIPDFITKNDLHIEPTTLGELDVSSVDLQFIDIIDQFEPYGLENLKPIFKIAESKGAI